MNASSGPRSRRGPKPRLLPTPFAGPLEPPVELGGEERAEFDRLVDQAHRRGLLPRLDPQALADLARAQVALNALYAAGARDVAKIAQMQNVVRGLRREAALTAQPSRVLVRPTPGEPSPRAYWQERLNGGE